MPAFVEAAAPPGTAPLAALALSKAVGAAATLLHLTNAITARVLGVSEATLSRLRAGHYVLDPARKEGELAILFVRLFRGLDAIVGGDAAAAASWLRAPNLALGARPLELIQTVSGLVNAVAYVDARRARV